MSPSKENQDAVAESRSELHHKDKPLPQRSRRKKNMRTGHPNAKAGMHRRHNKRVSW